MTDRNEAASDISLIIEGERYPVDRVGFNRNDSTGDTITLGYDSGTMNGPYSGELTLPAGAMPDFLDEVPDEAFEDEDEDEESRDAVEIMEDSRDLYERKNNDYGDSWKLTGKTLALWCEHNGLDELRIPVNEYTMISLGLFTRRLDKMIRHFNAEFLTDDLQVDESVVETTEDQVPYAAMHTQIAEEYAYADSEDLLP